MSKDMSQLFGELRSCINKLSTSCDNRILNNDRVVKDMSVLIYDFSPDYQQWNDIKFYIAQSLNSWFDESYHHGSSGLLAEIFGESARRLNLKIDVSYNQDRYGENSGQSRYTSRNKKHFISTKDSGTYISLSIISVLMDLIFISYNPANPFNVSEENPNERINTNLEGWNYIVDGRNDKDISLQIIRTLSKEYCKTKVNDELIEDEDGRFFAVINDLVKNTEFYKNNGESFQLVYIPNTSDYTKDFIVSLFQRKDVIDETMEHPTIELNYIIDIVIRNYMNNLYKELEINDIPFRTLDIRRLDLEIEDLEFKGSRDSLKNLI